ncbi:MAG: hypothetical protein Q7K42_02255 [Candidatus Diapherotrites archaeon]|nr:hypothetical protein [Candidatus Diapherotrites archaeon]
MVSVTLSVPEEVKKKMALFGEMNWSGFIRDSLVEKTKELEWKKKMLEKLSQEQSITNWSLELGREAKKGRFAELKKKGLV